MSPHTSPLPYYGAPADRWPAGSFQTGGNDLGMLLFFAFILLLVVLLIRLLYVVARRRPARATLRIIASVCGVYLAILLVGGVASKERRLPLGAMKCSDDWCVAVLGAARPASLGSGAQQIASAHGQFIVVNVRVFNNARRVAMRASAAGILLIDSQGNRYTPSARAQAALEQSSGPQLPLDSRLGPGEWFDSQFAFDVPGAAQGLRVFVGEGVAGKAAWINRIVPFDENSWLHQKAVYSL
jgi:hypothetical protein